MTMTDSRPDSGLSCFITNRISNVNVGGGTTKLTVRDDSTGTKLNSSFFTEQVHSAYHVFLSICLTFSGKLLNLLVPRTSFDKFDQSSQKRSYLVTWNLLPDEI